MLKKNGKANAMMMKYMNRMRGVWFVGMIVTCFGILGSPQGVIAQEPKDDTSKNGETIAAKDFADLSVTAHSAKIGGKTIEYGATAGTLTMADENGHPKAKMFFVAYNRAGVDDLSVRPITYCFNGGPGSSSVWLHLGAYGPKRVLMGDADDLVAPPWKLVDNNESLLDLTDLVFIDPVTTGYSRAVEGEDDSQFHGLNEDIRSVAEFIRLYTTRFDRWESPKFLAGESYGTTRAAGLSGYLQDRDGMYLNGIVLVSSILNFQTASFDTGNDLGSVLFLPTYAATNWYHTTDKSVKRESIEDFAQAAREFAEGEYATALMRGDQLSAEERAAIVRKVSYYTGLSEKYVDQANLRIKIWQFTKELLRDREKRTVGRLDSRFKGIDATARGESSDFDPSMAAINGPYTATLNQYVRSELGFESDLPYEILTGRVHPWNYRQYTNRYVNVAETLRSAMTKNRDLRVYVANGYYDLATPFFATEYTFSHLGLDPSLRDHVSMGFFEAGHMMYIRDESRRRLKKALTGFYKAAVGK